MNAIEPMYVYPLAVNLSAALLPIWAAHQVVLARRQIGLKYPAEYHFPIDETDKDKFRFNCTQRAHANLLELLPTFLILFNVAAVSFPKAGSAVGAVWIFARVLYQKGYGKYGPPGRTRGSNFAFLAMFILVDSPR